MKNKILAAIGVMMIFASLGAWYMYSLTIRENSELLGQDILVVAQDIKEGDPITSQNIKIKRIKQDDIVPNAISAAKGHLLNGKVAAINLYTNEQITEDRLTLPEYMMTEEMRLLSITIANPVKTLPGKVNANEYVDIWTSGGGKPELIMSNLRVLSLLDANGMDISGNPAAVPAALIVQANYYEDIVTLKEIGEADMFITKSPNQTGVKLEENKEEIIPSDRPSENEDETESPVINDQDIQQDETGSEEETNVN